MIGRALLNIGEPTQSIEVDGKMYYYEIHRFCGVMPTKQNGDPLKSEWPARVWKAVESLRQREVGE